LDLRSVAKPNTAFTVEQLKQAVEALKTPITPGSAIMLRTGQERFGVSDQGLYEYPGMRRDGTLYLADLGAKVLGTDALGWDRPFRVMRDEFGASGDSSVIWDAHFAGRDREVFIVQQMSNLAAIPATGCKIGFFPLRLARCSAAPCRAVAFAP
jgi:kynurenine formamidase